MTLGLLNCSSKKLPVRSPAWLMYSRSPRFSQQYQSLLKKASKVRILSAKHGLLNPTDVLDPYDFQLSELTGGAMARWIKKVREAILIENPDRILSYLSSGYRVACNSLGVPLEEVNGGVFQKSAKIGSNGKMRRGNWIVCWPIEWLLVLIASNPRGISLSKVEGEICARYSDSGTRRCQIDRVKKCPLHIVENGVIRNRYLKVGQDG